ncbi:glycosyltransferase family 4 protein [Pseudofulvibacter geojedonensis]|uniref:Glycosyltransferase family 4 protein n=1 Tax=Pseudofulvibacter geojedonensis TaxID=1123758 RepID=A0ABW3HYF6_9FLAO
MKFLVVTLAPTLKNEGKYSSYAPYVYEMNLWSKHINELGVVSPVKYDKELLLSNFDKEPTIFSTPSLFFNSLKGVATSLVNLPLIIYKIYVGMKWADHIHLRCPANISLLACIVQILFPNKPKTAKYAGNWDPNAKQPLSYKIQRWILSNTFLTKNIKVLIYGEWPKQSKNIKPFFTATYLASEISPLKIKSFDGKINFIFVGGLTPGKQPLVSVKVIQQLFKRGYDVVLNIYGDGAEKGKIVNYIQENDLDEIIKLHGNVNKEVIKEAFQQSHFLVFISKSEGWPKVVAEAMCSGCLPISTPVSCVPYMLGEGERGSIVSSNVNEIEQEVIAYLSNHMLYKKKLQQAYKWSSQFTLDKFETEIKKLLVE